MTDDERPALVDEPAGLAARLDAQREALAALEKQIGRAGREQFKANTLTEAQAARLAEALEALRAADERREAELAALRERLRAAQVEARFEVIRAVLPALDGLDEALRAGRTALEYRARRGPMNARPRAEQHDVPDADPSSAGALLRSLLGLPPPPDEARREAAELRATLASWLEGLAFVRRRLLDALAAEEVRPMDAEGRPFDPRYHIAAEAVTSGELPPGTVTQEIRRGYLAGERVLRHAEVAVTVEERDKVTR
jgi:molecular chaperone GrpE